MRNSKYAFKRLAIALGALLLVSAIGVAQVAVTIPTVTAKVGTSQSIPVNVGSLTGLGVVSYQFNVIYDPTIMTVTAVTAGPLVAGFNAPTVNLGTAGQVKIAGAGTTALSGSGTLVYLVTTMVGKGTTALTFNQFQFNEGTPAAATTNGSVIVPALSVKVSDISTLLPVGSTFTLPITTEAVTGLNVVSAQFTVTYDNTKINITGVSSTGTLTSGWSNPAVNTSVAGQLSYAGAGSTAITGTGTLVNLTGTVLVVGASVAVHFTALQYNEGTPAAGGVDGSVTTGAPQKPVLNSRLPATLTAAAQNNIIAFSVNASDPGGSALTYSWRLNDALVKGPGTDNTYSVRFTDPHGTAKKVVCVYTTAANLTDSTVWSFIVTGVTPPVAIPTDFVLGQNYPNPFNPTTLITYSLPKEAPVTFEVYNMLGVKVRTLMSSETRSAGTYTISWDGRNDSGVGMPSGVYMYRVLAGTYMASKKMTLLK
jgi:hypothetical protein